MATIAIVGIVASVAVPSFKYIGTTNRMSSEANALLGDMQFARVEAIREGQQVSICEADATESSCQAGGAGWAGGWIVFSDPNNTGQPGGAAGSILRAQKPLSAINNGADTFTGPVAIVAFNRDGFASGLTVAATMFTLHDAAGDAQFTRCLALNPTGYLAVVRQGITVGATTCT
ncbi:MAG TPA: GspH/FimT family pseudopilin [Steroidobacteraceae bacterium]|nr:GspH/FimT family pseudopilin [Steroidobacteraceae bacterium]